MIKTTSIIVLKSEEKKKKKVLKIDLPIEAWVPEMSKKEINELIKKEVK